MTLSGDAFGDPVVGSRFELPSHWLGHAAFCLAERGSCMLNVSPHDDKRGGPVLILASVLVAEEMHGRGHISAGLDASLRNTPYRSQNTHGATRTEMRWQQCRCRRYCRALASGELRLRDRTSKSNHEPYGKNETDKLRRKVDARYTNMGI
jgi:hypothetical protein